MKRPRKGRRAWKHSSVRVVLIVLLAMLLLAVLYQSGRWLEHRADKPQARGDHTQRYAYDNTITIDGAMYRRRGDITTILLMGIDTRTDNTGEQGHRNGGQADFLRLLAIDGRGKSIAQIQIDRDTMTPITVLGVLGNKAGVRTAQISLSHGFGDGRHQSCEHTMEAVSNLLFGVPINFYMALNMDGIPTLNDMLGGVTVTLEDDFSALDPSMTPGTTLTLTGDQAEFYVRSRMNVGAGTNEARMARQEQYLTQLFNLLQERMSEDKDYAGEAFDALKPYLTTNMSRGRLINEVWNARDYTRTEPVKPAGVHEVGSDGFMQFHVDEAQLRRIIMSLFYEKVK